MEIILLFIMIFCLMVYITLQSMQISAYEKLVDAHKELNGSLIKLLPKEIRDVLNGVEK